jgi:hypothetical protein
MLPEKQLRGSKKHGEFGGVTSITIVLHIRVDDKFDPMNLACNQVAGGTVSLRTREGSARELAQYSLRLVIHVHLPGIVRRMVGKRGVKLTVLVLEEKLHLIAVRLCVGNRNRRDVPIGVEPNAGILLKVTIPSDEDHRLVGGMLLRVEVSGNLVKAQVLMPQNPLGIDVVNGGLAGDCALQDPTACEVVKKRIVEGWLLAGCGSDG